MREVYFHKHEPGEHQFTLCGLLLESGTLNVGVAMRSPKEPVFIKAKGRSIAKARAEGKPYDVFDNFTKIHQDEQCKAITFYLAGLASRIVQNPDCVREIGQLYHASEMKHKVHTDRKPSFEFAP